MKLQNTLFILTVICFYILLCSQPADMTQSCAVIRWLKTVFEHDIREQTATNVSIEHIHLESTTVPIKDIHHESCDHNRPCSNQESYACSSDGFKDETKGFCVPRCYPSKTCSYKNHRCMWSIYNPLFDTCLPMTTEEWNEFPDCGDVHCNHSERCYGVTNETQIKYLTHRDIIDRLS